MQRPTAKTDDIYAMWKDYAKVSLFLDLGLQPYEIKIALTPQDNTFCMRQHYFKKNFIWLLNACSTKEIICKRL